MTCGIYTITSPSGGSYVGSSVFCERRWYAHRYHMKRGNHHNLGLNRAYAKYGERFFYSIIIICRPEDLILYEQIAIDYLKPKYNRGTCAVSAKGMRHTEAAREKNRQAHLGKKLTEEHKEKLRASLIGNKRLVGRHLTLSHKAAISRTNSGRPHKDGLRSRLGEEGVAQLKMDYASGIGLTALQKKYGAWHKSISTILRSEGVSIRKRGSPLMKMDQPT